MLCLNGNKAYAQEVAKAQNLVEQWLSIERQTSALESDWQQQKPMLTQRLALLEIEKKQLQSLLSEKSSDSSQVEQQRLALINEQSGLEQQQQTLIQGINSLFTQLAGIQRQLPPPVASLWQQESDSLEDEPALSAQLQVALQQLTKLAEFDQRISVLEANINNPEGETVLVKQLFLGAGKAWFVSIDGSYGGTGNLTEQGWQWRFEQQIDAKEITKAIAIFEKQREADFVRLPFALAAGGLQ